MIESTEVGSEAGSLPNGRRNAERPEPSMTGRIAPAARFGASEGKTRWLSSGSRAEGISVDHDLAEPAGSGDPRLGTAVAKRLRVVRRAAAGSPRSDSALP